MKGRHALATLALGLPLAGGAAAQAPALSGLSPTPTAPAAASADATPTPTPLPKLRRVEGPAADANARGQSLADIVRLSKEARKGQPPRKSLGTITNETLRKNGDAATPAARAPAKTGAKGGSTATVKGVAPTPFPTYDVPRDDNGRSEAEWRARVAHARALVVDAEKRVSALDTKAKQLENDFYAQSDGFRRDGVIKPAWDQARDDLAKARLELDAARKAIEDLEEEARRANAPPGWLR